MITSPSTAKRALATQTNGKVALSVNTERKRESHREKKVKNYFDALDLLTLIAQKLCAANAKKERTKYFQKSEMHKAK